MYVVLVGKHFHLITNIYILVQFLFSKRGVCFYWDIYGIYIYHLVYIYIYIYIYIIWYIYISSGIYIYIIWYIYITSGIYIYIIWYIYISSGIYIYHLVYIYIIWYIYIPQKCGNPLASQLAWLVLPITGKSFMIYIFYTLRKCWYIMYKYCDAWLTVMQTEHVSSS